MAEMSSMSARPEHDSCESHAIHSAAEQSRGGDGSSSESGGTPSCPWMAPGVPCTGQPSLSAASFVLSLPLILEGTSVLSSSNDVRPETFGAAFFRPPRA